MSLQHTRLGIFAVSLLLGSCSWCSGGIVHPKPGHKGSVKYCAQFDNCMACASQPGCGFCSEQGVSPVCQPGITSDDQPGTCSVPLTIGNSGCDAPPPPAAASDQAAPGAEAAP